MIGVAAMADDWIDARKWQSPSAYAGRGRAAGT